MKSTSDISPSTKLCGIIGNPVEHSMSPAIHNRAFAELGLDFVYLAFKTVNVEAALAGMRALENFCGLSVTIPHKMAVIPYLDEVAEVDVQIGSVNTVTKVDGKLKGLGSDGPGARQALIDNEIQLEDKSIVILGSGGAARAIAFDLAYNAKPASIAILGVVKEELENLAANLNAKTNVPVTGDLVSNETLDAKISQAAVLIHTTPIGMHPKVGVSAVPKTFLHKNLSVMDIVYNPLQTQLLKDAQSLGLKTVSGIEMFVNQAVVQFETWTGQTAPKAVMQKVVLDSLKEK